KGGADFARLAKQYSKDTVSAAKGGDLGWAPRDTYVKEFADKLFSMKEGEISEPVKTQFGYHIIRLDGIRPATGRSFEQVRDELAATLRNEQAATVFGNRQDQLQERLEKGGASLDDLAKQFGMQRGEVARFERGAGGLPLGSDADLNREVFSDASLTQRRIGGPLPLGQDRIVIFQVLAHTPASTKPLDEVRPQIVTALTRRRGADAAYAAARAAAAELGKGTAFDKAAANLKAKAQGPKFVGRSSPDVPVQLRDAVFDTTRPQPGKPVQQAVKMEDGTVALFQVTSWRVQPLSQDPQVNDVREQRELKRYNRRDIDAYISDIVKSAKVQLNPQAFAQ
ncbi:MAG TPA: peptidyl-prolyl cis-trans isomerase, partial [Steroidobacteraceae bacterium]|nr:peptidyl-prolyl cis-trans isomerase [Steroidobacteraceae bacterium]